MAATVDITIHPFFLESTVGDHPFSRQPPPIKEDGDVLRDETSSSVSDRSPGRRTKEFPPAPVKRCVILFLLGTNISLCIILSSFLHVIDCPLSRHRGSFFGCAAILLFRFGLHLSFPLRTLKPSPVPPDGVGAAGTFRVLSRRRAGWRFGVVISQSCFGTVHAMAPPNINTEFFPIVTAQFQSGPFLCAVLVSFSLVLPHWTSPPPTGLFLGPPGDSTNSPSILPFFGGACIILPAGLAQFLLPLGFFLSSRKKKAPPRLEIFPFCSRSVAETEYSLSILGWGRARGAVAPPLTYLLCFDLYGLSLRSGLG